MNRPIDSTAARQLSIRRIDDRIHVLACDVANHQLNPGFTKSRKHEAYDTPGERRASAR